MLRNKILKVVQETYQGKLGRGRLSQSSLEARFKTYYQGSAKVINGVVENICIYGKFFRTMDQ